MREKKTGDVATVKLEDGEFKVRNDGGYDASKIDKQFQTTLDRFTKELSENFSSIQNVLRDNNTELKNLNGNTINSLADITQTISEGNIEVIDRIGKSSERQAEADKNMISHLEALKQGKKDK